jgi:tetratricopeptide (TPR) repeat protein
VRLRALVVVCLLAWVAPVHAQDAPALERGRSLLADGRLWPAEQAAREAVAADPDSASAHQLLGRVLRRRNQGAAAVAELERAHTLDPSLLDIDRDLGIARFELGDRAGALAPLRRALEAAPDDAELRVRLGLCEFEGDHPGEAARHFEHASDDPVMGQLALYNLGLAHLDEGRRQEARSAFERAVARGPETFTGEAASAALDAMQAPSLAPAQTEKSTSRPYRLALGAGLLYDDNVVVEEIDDVSNGEDGGGVFELSSGLDLPVADLFEASLGYDFYQTLYFGSSELDLQSHTFSTSGTRPVGAVDATLGYTFSLSTLDSDRFLDFHEVRTSLGWAPNASWFLSPSAALRIKRFGRGRDEDRDAESGAFGLLQLLALDNWNRYVTLGAQVEVENADGDEFDYWGPVATLALRTPVPLPFLEKAPRFDARYRFRWRDYTNDDDRIGKERRDYIHQVRVRLDVPLVADFSLRTQYQFEDSDSNLPSADYTSNRVDMLLRYEL